MYLVIYHSRPAVSQPDIPVKVIGNQHFLRCVILELTTYAVHQRQYAKDHHLQTLDIKKNLV